LAISDNFHISYVKDKGFCNNIEKKIPG